MRRAEGDRQQRGELVWGAIGFVLVQLLLGLGVERFWLAVRDPEFVGLGDRLAQRRAEAPGRPLVLALGSSRTARGLHAEFLSQSEAGQGPLVFNFGILGSGSLQQQTMLRRLLDQGVRPDLLVVEALPMYLIGARDVTLEETRLEAGRLNATEVACLLPNFQQPLRHLGSWLCARVLPCRAHQAQLRDAAGLGVPGLQSAVERFYPLDAFGGRLACPASPEDRARNTDEGLKCFHKWLQSSTLADGPIRALRDLLALCRQERIPTALVLFPETAAFRAFGVTQKSAIDQIRALGCASDVPLYDARDWVADDGFYDGHHLAATGATLFTERFRREVLGPELRRLRPAQLVSSGR
jgi:hypothetical protein